MFVVGILALTLAVVFPGAGRCALLEPEVAETRAEIGEAVQLNRRALEYQNSGRVDEAESLYKRSLEIAEQALGPDHPGLAAVLGNLASLYQRENRLSEAELLYHRSVVLWSANLPLGLQLNNLAMLYMKQGRHHDAAALFHRSLSILDRRLGPDNPVLASVLSNSAASLHRIKSPV